MDSICNQQNSQREIQSFGFNAWSLSQQTEYPISLSGVYRARSKIYTCIVYLFGRYFARRRGWGGAGGFSVSPRPPGSALRLSRTEAERFGEEWNSRMPICCSRSFPKESKYFPRRYFKQMRLLLGCLIPRCRPSYCSCGARCGVGADKRWTGDGYPTGARQHPAPRSAGPTAAVHTPQPAVLLITSHMKSRAAVDVSNILPQ